MYTIKRHLLKISALMAVAALCLAAVGCAANTPAPNGAAATTPVITEFANGKGLSELVPEKIALSIGGQTITNGMGFLKNFYSMTDRELAAAAADPSLMPAELGGEDTWQENLLYSAYDNHGAPQYGYHRFSGISLAKALEALGVDISKPIAVEAKSFDGFSKILDDAFCIETKRHLYTPDGKVSDTVLPMLAFYETKLVVDSPEKAVEMPKDAGTEVMSQPLFAFGQTAPDENNNCSYVSGTVKIRAGMDSPAFVLETPNGIISISVSDLALLGRYSTEYSFEENGTQTHRVTGVPLSVLLEHWELSDEEAASIAIFTSDAADAVRTLSADEAARSFIAIGAQAGGAELENSTAVRLYCPGSTKAEVVVGNLTKGIIM